ncbi:unnamed protein product, partial [Phaeothamnion confervicola]
FQPGDRILLVGDNSQNQVVALLACWWAGLVPLCVAPPARLSPGQIYRESLQGWVELSGARGGWCEPDLLTRCQEVDLESGWHAFPMPFCEGEPGAARRESDDDLAYVQFSSGTTRRPKAVGLTGRSLSHNIQAILSVFPQPLSQHSCVSWLPLYHDMGLVGSLLSAVAAPGNLVLMRPYQFAARPLTWLQALTVSGATVSPAPNFALQQSLERIRDDQLEGLDLSRWQLALLGSETIHPETLRLFFARYRKYGLRWESLTPVYGLAEATLAVTFSPPGRGPRTLRVVEAETGGWKASGCDDGRELVSLGAPLPGIDVRICDDAGNTLPDGQSGRVLTRSGSVMRGYLGQDTEFVDGWLDTGDLGFFEQGELFLVGRSKDLLIVNGKNYDPEALEQALHEIEGLDAGRAAAVAAVDDSVVYMIAERRRKETLPEEPQREQARSAIARRTGLLVEVTLVESGWLPRTTS